MLHSVNGKYIWTWNMITQMIIIIWLCLKIAKKKMLEMSCFLKYLGIFIEQLKRPKLLFVLIILTLEKYTHSIEINFEAFCFTILLQKPQTLWAPSSSTLSRSLVSRKDVHVLLIRGKTVYSIFVWKLCFEFSFDLVIDSYHFNLFFL